MFIFWGFVVAVVSAGFVTRQNRVAQEAMQKSYTESVQHIVNTIAKSKNNPTYVPAVVEPTPVVTINPDTTVNPKPTPVVVKPTPKPTPTPKPIPTPVTPSGPTLETVATHNTQSDCWIVINGDVYSVASYIPMHPGGAQRIINQCGGDATAMFDGTGGRGSHRHSSYADSLLGSYLVGPLQ